MKAEDQMNGEAKLKTQEIWVYDFRSEISLLLGVTYCENNSHGSNNCLHTCPMMSALLAVLPGNMGGSGVVMTLI